jgi:hypothetical protein
MRHELYIPSKYRMIKVSKDKREKTKEKRPSLVGEGHADII